jgi:hypothetical protein
MTESIWDWSRTAATNSNADAGIGWAEGMSPAAINNSARGMMAALAKWAYDLGGQVVTAGTSTAYTATTTSGLGSLAEGRMLCVEMDETNGVNPTLNVDGLGAKKVYKFGGSGAVQMAAGELQAGGRYLLQYDTSLDTAAGGWIVLNPTAAEATAAEYQADTAGRLITVTAAWDAAEFETLTYAASYTADFATFINGVMTLTGNLTLNNPSNEKVGQSGAIMLIQDGTGSRTITFGTDWKFPSGASETLSTAAGSVDILYYTIYSATFIACSLVKGYS